MEENKLIDNRIIWIDTLKGICILCVMLIHIDFKPFSYSVFVHPFFLISFLFASGYTHNTTRGNKEHLIKRIKNLIIPFILMGFINIIATQIITFSEQRPISIQIKNMFLQIRGQDDIMWFIPALFVIDIIYHVILHNITNEKTVNIVIILLAALGIGYTKLGGQPLPWHIEMIGIGCFWMQVGHLYKKYIEEKLKKFVIWKLFILLFGVYVLVVFGVTKLFGYQGINFYYYGNSICLYFIESFLGLMFMVCVSKLLSDIKLLKFLGKNTLIYFAFHGKVESFIMKILLQTGILSAIFTYQWSIYVASILYVLLEAMILIIPTMFINKYLPFMVGKPYTRVRKKVYES